MGCIEVFYPGKVYHCLIVLLCKYRKFLFIWRIFDTMIIVTGAAGFIGSCLVSYLNQKGFEDLILVDEFYRADKLANLKGRKYKQKVEREAFQNWLKDHTDSVELVFHYEYIFSLDQSSCTGKSGNNLFGCIACLFV